MRTATSHIVVDLGFGDSGKGFLVDSICSKMKERCLVVRYTGGPQAGHTVCRDGKRHVFSSFGSGTLQGVPSFFGPETLVYPPNLMREYRTLKRINGGAPVKLYIDPRAKVIAPSDVAICRAVGAVQGRGGTCGLGVGVAMARHERTPYRVCAGALAHEGLLNEKIRRVEQTWAPLEIVARANGSPGNGGDIMDAYHSDISGHMADFKDSLESLRGTDDIQVMPFDMVNGAVRPRRIVFEGAQGVMLDRDFGIFPDVTYGHTTSRNAWALLREMRAVGPVYVHYVHRCYTTRHGNGWMPGEWTSPGVLSVDPEKAYDNMEWVRKNTPLSDFVDRTNLTNSWQGPFRVGEIDWDLVRAAIDYDKSFHPGPVPLKLEITCSGHRPGWKPPSGAEDMLGVWEVALAAPLQK